MFNKTYQQRAVRQAGGGHRVAEDALLRLPWAGIFEPWRPLVTVAAASRKRRHQPSAISRQLELFPENLQNIEISQKSDTRPLFDVFPEAYEEN